MARLALLPAFLAWAPAQAQAAPEAGTVAPSPSPEPIPLEDVADRAEFVRSELARLGPTDASREKLDRIAPELAAALPEIESRLASTEDALTGPPNARTLSAWEAQLRDAQESVLAWDRELDDELQETREALDRLDAMAASWRETADFAKRWGASATTTRRIQATLREIADTRPELLARGREFLTLRDRLVDPGSALRAGLAQLEAASASR